MEIHVIQAANRVELDKIAHNKLSHLYPTLLPLRFLNIQYDIALTKQVLEFCEYKFCCLLFLCYKGKCIDTSWYYDCRVLLYSAWMIKCLSILKVIKKKSKLYHTDN